MDLADEIFNHGKKEEPFFDKCCRIAKDYCSPFCLCGGTAFGLAVLGYDVGSYTVASMTDNLYRAGGDILHDAIYNSTSINVGNSVVDIRADLRESISKAVDLSTTKFGVSWGIGYYLSRKFRNTFNNWWKGRPHEHE